MNAPRPLALSLALLTTGCSIVGAGAPVEVQEYDLLPASLPAPQAESDLVPVTLQLPRFDVDPALDRDGLVWRRGAVEVGAYDLHRWARPPQDAVRDVLATALARVPGIVVGTEPPLSTPAHVLRGHVARCEEVDQGDRWSGIVEVTVVLSRRDGQELLRRTYTSTETADERNPPAVVAALRRGLDRIAERLMTDLSPLLRSFDERAAR